MRTEGVYTYHCAKCGTFFAVVSRFSVASDYSRSLKCPKCGNNASISGEGYINHKVYESNNAVLTSGTVEAKDDDYPDLLTAEHIAEIMGVSKPIAYQVMEYKGFPLLRIGRLKKVRKEKFYEWMSRIDVR